ncbi:MAG: MaoC/PaaZ C-terminal domain-containing protein [Paracoccaceae bacterium]
MTKFAQFTAPAHDRWFEDYVPGSVYLFGEVEVTEAEIIAFAMRYDPQPMHFDPDAALNGPYKGLIAPGWLTMGLMMRLLVLHYVSTCAALASPAFDDVRWFRPLRPSDRLSLRVTIESARVSQTKPDSGTSKRMLLSGWVGSA